MARGSLAPHLGRALIAPAAHLEILPKIGAQNRGSIHPN